MCRNLHLRSPQGGGSWERGDSQILDDPDPLPGTMILSAPSSLTVMQRAAFSPPLPRLPWGHAHIFGGSMPSPATARASVSVPATSSTAQEATAARASVSSPTWSSRCSPAETLGARWVPHTDKVASPCEGATAGPHGSGTVAKPAAATLAMAPTPAPEPTPVSTGLGVSPSTASVMALSDPSAH